MARIFIIEPDAGTAKTIGGRLADEGHVVHAATGLEAGLATLAGGEYRIALVDGESLFDRFGDPVTAIAGIRKAAPEILLILLLRDPSISAVAACIKAGAFDYLARPVQNHELLRSVNAAVNRASTEALNRQLAGENRLYQEHLETLMERQTADLHELLNKLLRLRDEERSMLSLELHDRLGQDLLALKLQLHALSARLGSTTFDDFADRAGELATGIRAISHRLSPLFLQSAGIVPALESLALEWRDRDGIELSIDAGKIGCRQWAENELGILYRLIEEALDNARLHSGARCVHLRCSKTPVNLTIEIRDTGCGFDQNTTKPGLGLILMRDAAARLGGILAIESSTECGTTVTCILPHTIQ